MAIDNNSLCYLFDSIFQVENIAGKPVVGGHIEVFIAGTDQKYITWQNFDGTKNPFKIPLNNDGRAVVLVEPHYTYDIYIYDSFNNMICSRLNVKPAIGGDVTVYGLTQVWHDESMSGEGTPQSPLSVVSAGKVYDGIEPIVVNNIENKISASHVPLGVQDPLYFVQDDEEGCIIGFSGQTIPEGVMSESALGYENNKITGYNGSAFSAGNEYEAGNYVSINNNTISITGLQPEGDYAYNSALSSKLDVTALPQDLVHSGDLTAYQPAGNYLSATDSANFYPIDNPSGFITGVDLTDYATTAQLDEKLDKTDSGNFYPMTGNPSGFLTAHQSLQGYASEQWVEGKGYITGIDIQESANWNEATTVVNNNSAIWNNTTNVISSNSAQWGASNPQIPVTGINGIKISESGDKVVFEVSADYATQDWVTAQGYLTAHQSLEDYQTTAGMTGYLTTADSANFLTAVPTGTMNESGFGYDANDKISGYNGSAFAGGSDVPEGVMVESGLEYNAVNEISGYNGSAIAQYGAEKQWLQHDDTIVHVSNSAQYAFGVNVSAVQTLMNVSPISAGVAQANITATGNAGAISKVVTTVTADVPDGWEFMTWTTCRTVGWIGSVYPGGITNSAVSIWGVYGGNHTSTAECKVECGYLIRKTI